MYLRELRQIESDIAALVESRFDLVQLGTQVVQVSSQVLTLAVVWDLAKLLLDFVKQSQRLRNFVHLETFRREVLNAKFLTHQAIEHGVGVFCLQGRKELS